jgi:glycosyltransferase involved in cell wall biosynthesis
LIALVLKLLTRTSFVFDMRGFWADERVDGGLWAITSRKYRVAKWLERQFLLHADHVVSLTEAAVREMEQFDYLTGKMPPVTVIPTCADLDRFRPISSPKTQFVLGYVGSVGTWYLFDEVVACFKKLQELVPESQLLIINRLDHVNIVERLKVGEVPMDFVELRAASHAEVPAQMGRMHAGIFFIKPVFSKQASAPTKLGEFLGCGIPCLSNAGVGDMAEILESEKVGVAISKFDADSLENGVRNLLRLVREPGIEQRCVSAAWKHFSLEEGVRQYASIYQQLG